MNKLITLVLCLFLTFSFSTNSHAQDKNKTKIGYLKHKGKDVLFNITGSKPFIFGGNTYVLHIGSNEFTIYQQTKVKNTGSLTFTIYEADFQTLRDDDNIYLTYGNLSGEEDLEDLSKEQYSPCWSLGKFSKKLLTK